MRASFKKNTKIVWVESATNPDLNVVDIRVVAKMCKEKGALLVVDNTFMSPALCNPLKLGADIVLHSLTKYIGGHSDLIGGALMFDDDQLYDKLFFNMKTMGSCIPPFNAWLSLRGSKTLKLRIE